MNNDFYGLKYTECGKDYDINLKFCIKCELTFQLRDLSELKLSEDWRGIWRFSNILPYVEYFKLTDKGRRII